MKNNLKNMGWAFLIALSLYACKKDQKQSVAEQDAKSWYLKTTQKTSYALSSSKNISDQVSRDLNWNDAKTFVLNNGTEVLGVPMKLKLANGSEPKGSYMLMIGKNEQGFSQTIVYNGEKDYFRTISKEQVQSAFNQGVQLAKMNKLAKSRSGNGKIMSEDNGTGEGDQPVCTDWYLVETFRDGDGNITGTMETYLYTTCTGTGGGGGGGGGENSSFDWGDLGHVISEDAGASAEADEVIEGVVYKTRDIYWKFYRGVTFTLTSREKGLIKVTGGTRTWYDLSHKAISQDGGWLLGDVEPVNMVFTPYVGPSVSMMEADFDLKYTPGLSIPVGGTGSPVRFTIPPRTIPGYYGAASWNTNFVKQ